MAYDYDRARRLPVDPRIVSRISNSPEMSREQGANFMEGWGGPSGYAAFSQLPVESRLVYMAVLEDYTTPIEIAGITGLTSTEVAIGLADLRSRRLVSAAEAV